MVTIAGGCDAPWAVHAQRLSQRTTHSPSTISSTGQSDRKSDMIISGGMNVYPAEIEAALERHPGVLEAAVFGVPDEQWDERVHAVVVVRPGHAVQAEDVIAFAREHLAGYKVPRSVAFATELPHTGSGKVLKRELREPYWQGRRTRV
jgi:fatty-acyl-CoA synthase/long-chain acyl-CoA synthetase